MKSQHTRLRIAGNLAAFLLIACPALAQATRQTRNVVLIVTDGLRWQDVFTGADSSILFGDPRWVGDTARVRRDFWRPTPDARRAVMMPWLWSIVARDGQIFGNQRKGSIAQVTNGLKFSYPGYNEMLTGAPDSRIRSNTAGPNPNVTVFEWLHTQPGFHGRVSAFGTWATFGDIFNRDRAGFVVRAGWEAPYPSPRSRADTLLNRLYATTFRTWDEVAYDSFMQAVVLDHIREQRPRLLFVGYGETDEWAHSGRYDRVLRSANAVDGYIEELWDTLQSLPEYRGTTTMIITTDHGRGDKGTAWRDHGERVDGAENTWIAVIGPDTPARGERTNAERVTQGQIAGTVAAFLGLSFGRGTIADVIR
jgi:hypothetical protein